jgi:hypothetical protein
MKVFFVCEEGHYYGIVIIVMSSHSKRAIIRCHNPIP